jgi:peptide/nickel transport system substrate-binding protein
LNKQVKNIFVIIFSLLFILSCSKKEDRAELTRHGGEICIALNSAIEDLFPLTTEEYNVEQIHKFMLTPSFVSFDDNGNAFPNIADIWKTDEQNLSITFILNQDLKWSNGSKVTINDVKYTVELLKKYNKLPRFESIINNIKDFKIIDSLSCQISFNQAVAEPLYFTNFPIFPVENNYDISDLEKFKESYFNSFVGCGPFTISNYNADSLSLTKNNYFLNNFPYLTKVVFKYAGDSEEIQNLIQSEKIDFAVNMPMDLLANKTIQEKFNILSYPEKGYTFVGWNLKSPLLKNKNMRLALSHSIDRQTLIDGILGGYSEIVDGPVYHNQKGAEKFLPQLDFNAVKAESLFNSIGWAKLDQHGIRIKNGKKLSIKMLVNKENEERIELANNIKANLKSLGVELLLHFVTWKDLLKAIDSKSSDAILLTWTDSDYYDPSLLFHSKAIKHGLNFMSYKSNVTDSLIDQALFTWDKKQKDYYWIEFQKKIANDLPCTFLFSQKIIVGCSKKIQNVQMDSRGFLPNIKEWWIE